MKSQFYFDKAYVTKTLGKKVINTQKSNQNMDITI